MNNIDFGPMILQGLTNGVVTLVDKFGDILFKIILIVVALLLLTPVLPDDPFRTSIYSITGTYDQWRDLIEWIVPVKFIVSTGLFCVSCWIFFYIFRTLYNAVGVSITGSIASNTSFNASNEWH